MGGRTKVVARKKVLLVEVNEVTWNLIDPLIEQGKLPTFARLKKEGAWAAPMSVDLPPQLDPWITWTTVYTGSPQSDHNVFFLQQPPETMRRRLRQPLLVAAARGQRLLRAGHVCARRRDASTKFRADSEIESHLHAFGSPAIGRGRGSVQSEARRETSQIGFERRHYDAHRTPACA